MTHLAEHYANLHPVYRLNNTCRLNTILIFTKSSVMLYTYLTRFQLLYL